MKTRAFFTCLLAALFGGALLLAPAPSSGYGPGDTELIDLIAHRPDLRTSTFPTEVLGPPVPTIHYKHWALWNRELEASQPPANPGRKDVNVRDGWLMREFGGTWLQEVHIYGGNRRVVNIPAVRHNERMPPGSIRFGSRKYLRFYGMASGNIYFWEWNPWWAHVQGSSISYPWGESQGYVCTPYGRLR